MNTTCLPPPSPRRCGADASRHPPLHAHASPSPPLRQADGVGHGGALHEPTRIVSGPFHRLACNLPRAVVALDTILNAPPQPTCSRPLFAAPSACLSPFPPGVVGSTGPLPGRFRIFLKSFGPVFIFWTRGTCTAATRTRHSRTAAGSSPRAHGARARPPPRGFRPCRGLRRLSSLPRCCSSTRGARANCSGRGNPRAQPSPRWSPSAVLFGVRCD